MHKLSWREKIRGHVSGPAGSILFHIVLLLVMIQYLTGDGGSSFNAMVAEMKLPSTLIEIEPVKEVQKEDGTIGYSNEDRRTNPGLTGAGVLGYQLGGMANSPEAKKGLDALLKVEGTYEGVKGGWPMYSLYYVTQAKFNGTGGKGVQWKTWNSKFAPTLFKSQQPDGSWDSPNVGENAQGKVVNTALAALSLQVYWRRLPSYSDKAMAAPVEVEPPKFEDGDIEINL